MVNDTPKLPAPAFMLVTDRRLAGGGDALVRAVSEAVEGGVNVVQLREKDLPPSALLPLARRLRDVIAGRALLLVNGPLEVALEVGADGLHLPEGAAMIQRPAIRFVVGRSVHSLDAAQRAAEVGADYVVAGPAYETPSHPGAPAAGVALIRRIAGAVSVPVIGIGGITQANAGDVVRAGASGVAVISSILNPPKVRAAAAELSGALDAAWVAAVGSR